MSSPLKNLVGLAALVVAAGCAPEKPSEADDPHRATAAQGGMTGELSDESVVTVDGEAVTLADFDERIDQLPEYARARYSGADRRKSYLQSVAHFEVMADRAEAGEFDNRPEVLEALKDELAALRLEQLARDEADANVDQAAIEAYYDEHRDEFEEPAARRAAVIPADSRREAERVRERVERRLEEADGDEAVEVFRTMAATHGVEPAVAREGGDVGFIEAPEADPNDRKLAEAIFSLSEPGEPTEVVSFDDRYAVATFFDERDAERAPLEAVASQIRRRLTDERLDERRARALDRLRDEADLDVDRDRAKRADRPAEPGPRSTDDLTVEEIAPFSSSDRAARSERAEDDSRE